MFSLRNRLLNPAPLALLFFLLAAFTGSAQTPNAAPSFMPGGNVTAAENAGPQRVPWATDLSARPAGESAHFPRFGVTNDNQALFAAPPALDASGILTFTPTPDACGTAMVTVVLRDNGGMDASQPHTFTVTVAPVNDAPIFTKGPNVSVLEDSGPQRIAGWATAIAAGPANESTQSLAFLVTASPTTLFKALPTIDPQGNLTFTPAPDAYGTATVSVVLRDNGGTEHGGADRSRPQTFTLSIAPANDAPFLQTPAPVFLAHNSPAHTLPLTGITPGPGENSQSLAITAVSDNPVLLDIKGVAHAAGDATASLIFQPRPGQTGTATITVVMKDNGGTTNGGLGTYTTAFRVHVAAKSPQFLPMLFSPNGDGQNDAFQVRGVGIASVPLRLIGIGYEGIRVLRIAYPKLVLGIRY
jgi:hypothetical protein